MSKKQDLLVFIRAKGLVRPLGHMGPTLLWGL